MKLSIIVPAYNEANRITCFLKELVEFALQDAAMREIIVVDDGSSDHTVQLVKEMAEKYPFITLLKHDQNRGKGAAVKLGSAEAKGDIQVFMDADGSYGPDQIVNNLKFFDEGYDVVIGSRFMEGSVKDYEEGLRRKVMRTVFNRLVHLFLFDQIQDTQCGFKMFRRSVANVIYPEMRLTGFGFDLEFIYLALKNKFKIKESPVTCYFRDGSKVRVIRDTIKIFFNLFEIRKVHGKLT